MPLIETKGAGSAQGFGEFTQSASKVVYIEDVFSTYLYTGNRAASQINNGLPLGSNTATSGGGAVFLLSNFVCSSTVPSTFGTGDFTVEGFFYVTALNATYGQALIQCWTGPADGDSAWGLRLDTTGKIVTATYNTVLSTAASAVSLNTWNHIAWARSGSSNAVWLNGTRINTYTNSFDYNRAVNSRYGTDSQGVPGSNFIGAISNVRLVKGSAVYNPSSTTITVPTSALTAVTNTSYLVFQGTSPFTDNSGNGYGFTNASGGGYVPAQATNFGPFAATAASVVKGGMVWIKDRTSAYNHNLFNTVQGVTKLLHSNTADAQVTDTTSLTSFNSNGFTIGQGTTSGSEVNAYSDNIVSWSFVKQPKFFDIVTWTGSGTPGRTISHSLGSVPGCIMVKCTSTTISWFVYHKDANAGGATTSLNLASTTAVANDGDAGIQNLTSTTFQLGGSGAYSSRLDDPSATYVAYIFASNAGGFGLAGTDNVISCGTFTTDASGNATINLGYEPQFFLYKGTDFASNWVIVDTMRGFVTGNVSQNFTLFPNSTASESSTGLPAVTSTGVNIATGGPNTFIYIAIRRGPMKVPTLGTSVFSPTLATFSGSTVTNTGFVTDMVINKNGVATTSNNFVLDRLRGSNNGANQTTMPSTSSISAEVASSGRVAFTGSVTIQNGYLQQDTTANNIVWAFGRAPGFFDEVCYTGTGVNRTVTHNLAVVPELMIVKKRNAVEDWGVYTATTGNTGSLRLNTTGAFIVQNVVWNDTSPTSSVFTVGTNSMVNATGDTYVWYGFATCPGVSKVGTYTGTGATQTISCGFTGGARFVLVKRTDTTGDWYVWDTARGMISGTDPSLLFNSTAAEVNANSIYTATGGFQIVSTAAGINASGGTYIFLAIA